MRSILTISRPSSIIGIAGTSTPIDNGRTLHLRLLNMFLRSILIAFVTVIGHQPLYAANTLPGKLTRYDVTIISSGGFTSTYLSAINNHGVIVGSTNTFGFSSAVVRTNGVSKTLPKGNFDDAFALDINDDGRIVGSYGYAGVIFSGSHFAVEWVFEGPSWIDTRINSGNKAHAVSNNGVIVGQDCTLDGKIGCEQTTGFVVLPGGTVLNIETFGGASSIAYNVNDLEFDAGRMIVGKAQTAEGTFHAFVLPHATGADETDLGTLPPLGAGHVPDSVAGDVNNADPPLIVGSSRRSLEASYEAVIWFYSDGEWHIHSLGSLGTRSSGASAINDHNYVVGNALISASQYHAFIDYDPFNGAMFDINDLIPCDEIVVLETAADINNMGQIVGSTTVGGMPRGYLLDPFPAGDCDRDGLATLTDAALFVECMTGPLVNDNPSCSCFDMDCSNTIDLLDLATFQQSFGLPIR